MRLITIIPSISGKMLPAGRALNLLHGLYDHKASLLASTVGGEQGCVLALRGPYDHTDPPIVCVWAEEKPSQLGPSLQYFYFKSHRDRKVTRC